MRKLALIYVLLPVLGALVACELIEATAAVCCNTLRRYFWTTSHRIERQAKG